MRFYKSVLTACFFSIIFSVPSNAQEDVKAFMEEELKCSAYVFPQREFPQFYWADESRVEKEIGKTDLRTVFYNKDFKQVTTPDQPGRYGAVIEGTTSSGFIIKRYVTLFCTDAEFDDYSPNVPVTINNLSEYGIDESKWDLYKQNPEHFSFGSMKFFPKNDPDAAIFLAGMQDLDVNMKYDTPRIRDRQWWIKMKGVLEKIDQVSKPLRKAKVTQEKLPLLSDSVFISPAYDKNVLSKINNVCSDWAVKGGEPNVTLIIHKGKIIFRGAFGKDKQGNPVDVNSRMWMASITKLLTGFLMMQFVDQGIVDIDAPVNKYLPEIGSDKIKVRSLFTHTTGLDFALDWASDWNQSLENQIAQLMPYVEPEKSFSYNRVGYAIAGKMIERLTGTAIPYLFQRYIFEQMGMKTAYSDNTYGGLYCSADDLAKLGQMLLNSGTYNYLEFISKQTFNKMLPQKLLVSEKRWGIGTSQFKGHGLSEKAFGHGAASGTIFIIDPESDLVIISARNRYGSFYDEFENNLIELCTSLVKNK